MSAAKQLVISGCHVVLWFVPSYFLEAHFLLCLLTVCSHLGYEVLEDQKLFSLYFCVGHNMTNHLQAILLQLTNCSNMNMLPI